MSINTCPQSDPFSYRVDPKALNMFNSVHFLHVLMQLMRKPSRSFSVSWLTVTYKKVQC